MGAIRLCRRRNTIGENLRKKGRKNAQNSRKNKNGNVRNGSFIERRRNHVIG